MQRLRLLLLLMRWTLVLRRHQKLQHKKQPAPMQAMPRPMQMQLHLLNVLGVSAQQLQQLKRHQGQSRRLMEQQQPAPMRVLLKQLRHLLLQALMLQLKMVT